MHAQSCDRDAVVFNFHNESFFVPTGEFFFFPTGEFFIIQQITFVTPEDFYKAISLASIQKIAPENKKAKRFFRLQRFIENHHTHIC